MRREDLWSHAINSSRGVDKEMQRINKNASISIVCVPPEENGIKYFPPLRCDKFVQKFKYIFIEDFLFPQTFLLPWNQHWVFI